MAKELLRKLIFDSISEDYTDQTIKYNDDMDVISYLTDMSSAILRWYPFKKNAIILELNASFGARTGALCDIAKQVIAIVHSEEEAECLIRRYDKRSNLKVFIGITEEIRETRFDYIISFGEMEVIGEGSKESTPYLQYLRNLSNLLKMDGKLLLNVENRYALKKLCGEVDSFTGIPFDGISGYREKTIGKGFSKNELEALLTHSPFLFYKFYYPLYDSVFPKIIYTDKHLPEKNIFERYINYYRSRDTIVIKENDFLLDLIENGMLSFFSNEFLIEASKIENLTDINMVSFSSQRKREQAFAVIFSNQHKVIKKCLYREGLSYAKELCEDSKYLINRDVPSLLMNLDGDQLLMDYINAPTLQQYLVSMVENYRGKEELIEIYDHLWNYILKSSEYSEDCAFSLHGLEAGPILKKAFIEMIPLNCFWLNGKFCFFDQEFVKENYPASFVMMRAIRNGYEFAPGLTHIMKKEELAERYYLTNDLWDLYLKIDVQFVTEVNAPLEAIRKYRIGDFEIRENCKRMLDSAKESERYHDFYELLYCWKQIESNEIAQYLRRQGFETVAIYGYGKHGKLLYQDLKSTGIQIVAWIDKNATVKEFDGIIVLKPSEIENLNVDTVIITPYREFDSIEKSLKQFKRNVECISLNQLIETVLKEKEGK